MKRKKSSKSIEFSSRTHAGRNENVYVCFSDCLFSVSADFVVKKIFGLKVCLYTNTYGIGIKPSPTDIRIARASRIKERHCHSLAYSTVRKHIGALFAIYSDLLIWYFANVFLRCSALLGLNGRSRAVFSLNVPLISNSAFLVALEINRRQDDCHCQQQTVHIASDQSTSLCKKCHFIETMDKVNVPISNEKIIENQTVWTSVTRWMIYYIGKNYSNLNQKPWSEWSSEKKRKIFSYRKRERKAHTLKKWFASTSNDNKLNTKSFENTPTISKQRERERDSKQTHALQRMIVCW